MFQSGNDLKVTVQNISSRTLRGLSILLGKQRVNKDWSGLAGGGLAPNMTASLTVSIAGLPAGGTRHHPAPPGTLAVLGAVFTDGGSGPAIAGPPPADAARSRQVESTPAGPVQATPVPAVRKADPPRPIVAIPNPVRVTAGEPTPMPVKAKADLATATPPAPRVEQTLVVVPGGNPAPVEVASRSNKPVVETLSPPTAPPPPDPKVERTPRAKPAPFLVPRPAAPPPAAENPIPAQAASKPVVDAPPPPMARVNSTPATFPPPAATAPIEEPKEIEPPPVAAPGRATVRTGTREQGCENELAKLISLVEAHEPELASPYPRQALRKMIAAVVKEQNALASQPAAVIPFDQGQLSAVQAFAFGLQTIQDRRDLDDDTLREQVGRFLRNQRRALAKP